jgi:hypothetical protein
VWRLPLPLAELARQDSAKKQRRTEVSGVTGRWIGRGYGMTGHVRAVAAAVRRGSLGFCTSVSGHSRDRRVRSGARGTANAKGSIRHGGASGHDRPDASGRAWVLTKLKPGAECNASGQL